MVTKDQFYSAIKVIQEALGQGVVTLSLTSSPMDRDKVLNEILISCNHAYATYYYEDRDENTCRGIQEHLQVGFREPDAVLKLEVAAARAQFDKAMQGCVDARKSMDTSIEQCKALEQRYLELAGKVKQ